MEPCTANKNQGLREGYKWLVRSIIAKLDILGPRVEADVEDERLRENERKIEIRKRIEERKRLEGRDGEAEEDSNGDNEQMPGKHSNKFLGRKGGTYVGGWGSMSEKLIIKITQIP